MTQMQVGIPPTAHSQLPKSPAYHSTTAGSPNITSAIKDAGAPIHLLSAPHSPSASSSNVRSGAAEGIRPISHSKNTEGGPIFIGQSIALRKHHHEHQQQGGNQGEVVAMPSSLPDIDSLLSKPHIQQHYDQLHSHMHHPPLLQQVQPIENATQVCKYSYMFMYLYMYAYIYKCLCICISALLLRPSCLSLVEIMSGIFRDFCLYIICFTSVFFFSFLFFSYMLIQAFIHACGL